MWLRWCALAMVAGFACVTAGLGLAAHGQVLRFDCPAECPEADAQQRLAVELALLGVIVSSLSTAAVAAILMRQARPPVRRAPRASPSAVEAPRPLARR